MEQILKLFEERLDTPVGEVVLLTDAASAVRAVDYADYDARMRRLLDRHYGKQGWTIAPIAEPSHAAGQLRAYFSGDLTALDGLTVETGGTAFQRSVWGALRKLPTGATTSYGELAHSIGRPSAMRAAGLANGANPVAIVVPCHRVIGKSGALTGYAGGLERKRWLLQHERGSA